jgi:hypothetical protein
MMKPLPYCLAALTLCSAALAQETAPAENPNVYGRWEFTAQNGMRGELLIDADYCNLSYTSSFASASFPCGAFWREETNRLFIVTRETQQGIFSVPDYPPDTGGEVAVAQGNVNLGMEITRFGRDFMSGHLTGA